MTNLTKEEIAEIQRIVDGAPETAIEVCLYDYGDSEQITYLNCESQFYDDEEEFKWVDMELVDDFFHSRRNLSDLRTILAQQQEIERLRNPWISVEDELPNEGVSVLIYNSFGETNTCRRPVIIDTNKSWEANTGEFSRPRITHWMPLPKPPKGESE